MIIQDDGLLNQVGAGDVGMWFGSYSMAQVSEPGQMKTTMESGFKLRRELTIHVRIASVSK